MRAWCSCSASKEEDRTNRPTELEPKNQTWGNTQHRREAAAPPLVT